MLTISKRRSYPLEYVKETAEINARKENYKGPHKFKAAKWTHPNGHPRCSLCGDEEIIGGICNVVPTAEDRETFKEELAEEFGKDFDPNQPRDNKGRWVDTIRATSRAKRSLMTEIDNSGYSKDSPIRGVVDNYRGSHKTVARDGERVVGAIDFTIDRSGKSIAINDVRAMERGKGIGREMLMDVARSVKGLPGEEKYQMRVYSAVSSSKSWYMKMGADFVEWSSIGTWSPEAVQALASGKTPKSGRMEMLDGSFLSFAEVQEINKFESFTKGFDPNQPRDRLGRWWDGVPRAYGVYDTNSSGRATGNDVEAVGSRQRRSSVSRVSSSTAGVTNMPGRANKAQRNRGSDWVLRNLTGSERNYGTKVIEHASRGKNIQVATREAFAARNKVARERLFDIENSLIDVMFRIEKRYSSFTKANPLWDGDGVQGVGQPRGKGGRWTDTAGGAVAARVARATSSATAGAVLWDHRRKTLASNVKLTRLPHGGQHAIEVNGKKVARKNYTPEQALYLRNNGSTKITNARLAEIHKDRSKITPAERDLLMSAGAQAAIDGDDDVKVWVVRDKAFKPRPRYSIIANLRKEIANDVARQSGDTGEGSTKHVTRRTDLTAETRGKENKKRVESGRNTYARIRKDMVDQFSSDGGKTVRCIFCGKPVAASVASPERMKPGPIGGRYEIGNVAPAHERCNTVAGQVAQYDPEKYYDEMMAKFAQMYVKMTPEQKKRMQPIFTKNRAKLGARPR